MSYVHRTMIVPASLAPLARSLAEAIAGPAGAGMWPTGLAPDGANTPTHYVSSGMIEDTFAAVIIDAELMHSMSVEAGVEVPLETLKALVVSSDVSDDPPFDAFARLGLTLTST